MALFKPNEPRYFPHTPWAVRATLSACKYDQAKAARDLGVDPDELWEFLNGTVYMRYIREQAHADMLKMLDKVAEETPKNIAALVEIRDECGTDRDRISAVKALVEIFKAYKVPAAPVEVNEESGVSAGDRSAAVERVREALRKSKPRSTGQTPSGRIN